jgi:hypothetical protein
MAEFDGLTISACATACNAERCVISGRGICAHPCKGGLQGTDKGKPEAVARLAQAKGVLGLKEVAVS